MSSTPPPQGRYLPATREGNIVFTAGMTPRDNGVLIQQGKVSADQPLHTYQRAVKLAAANALRAAQSVLSEDEHVARVLSMTVYVAAQDPFEAHAKLADFASAYLYEALGEAGISSRAAVGVWSLPGNAPVEVSLVASVGTGPRAS